MTLPAEPRPVFMVLSARSLPYASLCLKSLLTNALEPLALTLITDGPEDKDALTETMGRLEPDSRHRWSVFDEAEARARADDQFARYPNVRQFRQGHPCWRKITDPPLFAPHGSEMVVIDPDVYFPNPFRFEPTPPTGLLLMWQKPNCLLPPPVVARAFDLGIPMADHVDIGVCHVNNPLDWEWIDDLIGRLGGRDIPTWSPHVEPIIWAALGMRIGGGYLDPQAWLCWRNSLWKRARERVLKVSGLDILRGESVGRVKCFHAGGHAKWWLADALKAGLFEGGEPQEKPLPVVPFVPYTRAKFERKQLMRGVARRVGILKLVGSAD